MVTLLIGADLCPIEGNRRYFQSGQAEILFNDLLPEMQAADLVIANLECPLIEQPSPILKTGPVFGEGSDCINGIKQAGIDVLCLANNHILDHGAPGLKNTMKVCAEAGIKTVGAGENLAVARQVLIQEIAGVRVGILAMAEHEFSIATKNSAGANPLDVMDFVRNVARHKSEFDYLVVLLHGGDEFYVPTPRLRDTCHFLIEMGANAVIVQHPHVLGGYEEFCGGHIVYGQGAWIMDEAIYRDSRSFHEGFLVKLLLDGSRNSRMEIIPFVQSVPPPGARRLTGEAEQQFRVSLDAKSAALKNDLVLEEQWIKFCERKKHAYLSALLGHNRWLAKLNAQGWVERIIHGRLPLLRAKNMACCETHREAIETIFNHGLL